MFIFSLIQVPVVLRGDLVPENGLLFMDVEKLSMKVGWGSDLPYGRKQKHRQVANNVAIVDQKGTLIFWAFIRREPEQICQYFTSLHRINRTKLEQGVEISTVRNLLEKILHSNKLIGLKVEDDLKSLSLEDEFKTGKYFTHRNLEDLQDFYVDSSNQPIKMKDVALHYDLAKSNFQDAFHACTADARMHLKLYLKKNELQSESPDLFDTTEIAIRRSPNRKYQYDKNDICKCIKAK